LHHLKLSWRVIYGAFLHFLADDGWAIASHIALSTLMALFPFMIVVTALAAFFFGSKDLADEAARILLEAWPPQVAGPISADITGVLTNVRGDVLTFGVLFAIYFASSGVESLRIGLNRAYDMAERRPWWLLRLESILYVLVAAVAILAFSLLVVLAPFLWDRLVLLAPQFAPFSVVVTFARYVVAAMVLVIALTVIHSWLGPAQPRRDRPRHRRDARLVAHRRRRIRPLSRRVRLRLCVDVCGTGIGDDRADLSLCLRVDFRLRRGIEFDHQQGAQRPRRRGRGPRFSQAVVAFPVATAQTQPMTRNAGR